jgi:hypothetical protein
MRLTPSLAATLTGTGADFSIILLSNVNLTANDFLLDLLPGNSCHQLGRAPSCFVWLNPHVGVLSTRSSHLLFFA